MEILMVAVLMLISWRLVRVAVVVVVVVAAAVAVAVVVVVVVLLVVVVVVGVPKWDPSLGNYSVATGAGVQCWDECLNMTVFLQLLVLLHPSKV